jgi:hypothetical protein
VSYLVHKSIRIICVAFETHVVSVSYLVHKSIRIICVAFETHVVSVLYLMHKSIRIICVAFETHVVSVSYLVHKSTGQKLEARSRTQYIYTRMIKIQQAQNSKCAIKNQRAIEDKSVGHKVH